MGALEMTVVSTAMPTVIGELGGIQHYSWVFTAYLLASTVTVPFYGKLADLYGRKPIMLLGIVLFLVGSATSGLSTSMLQLIVFRGIQGFGAGAMQPIALTIVGDIFELKERGRVQGWFSAAWGIAGLVGPLVGGIIVHYLSWRWVFYLNLPFGIASGVLLALGLHERVARQRHYIDVLGAILLATGNIALLLAFNAGKFMSIGIVLGVTLLTVLLWWESRVREPLFAFDLFTRRVIAVSSGIATLLGASMLTMVTFVPLYVQGVLGKTAVDAGTVITPMVIGWPIASTISGRLIPRVGFRVLIRSGLALSAISAAMVAVLLSSDASLALSALGTACFGAGIGFANTPLLIAVQSSVEWRQRGVATASTMFFRTVGGALAIGALGAFLAAALAKNPSLPIEAANQLLGPDHGSSLDPSVLRQLAQTLQTSLHVIFWSIFGISLTGFLVSWIFPRLATWSSSAGAAPALRSLDSLTGEL
jgi:EmrB/QacA subfamily drug resistance transporter